LDHSLKSNVFLSFVMILYLYHRAMHLISVLHIAIYIYIGIYYK